MSGESTNRRKKQLKMRKRLLIMWAIFIPVVIVVAIFVLKNKDEVMEDMGLKDAHIYEENAIPEINQLMQDYYSAYAACDEMRLKALVVDPSQYDDMTIVQKKAEVVTGYNNITCYTIKGRAENTYVVYTIANISIANVVSTPLDMNPALYVVKKGNTYMVDNTALSKDVTDYIASLNQNADIKDLMQMVKDDQQRCAAQDETFRVFYDRLTGNGQGGSGKSQGTEQGNAKDAATTEAVTKAE